jgi:hypothetical protein
MARSRTQSTNDHTRIERPRFPRLKAKHEFEVLQYRYGREFIIGKIEYLAWKFKDELDACIKPMIRNTTEPYEILKWYYYTVKNVFERYPDLETNLDDWICRGPDVIVEDERYEGLVIDELIGQQELFLLGVNWIDQIPTRYQKWFRYIYSQFRSIGFYSIWDYCQEYMVDKEHMAEMYEIDDVNQLDMENENHALYASMIKMIDIIENETNVLNHDRPKNMPHPKNKKEEYLSNKLQKALDLLELIGNYNIYQNYRIEDGEHGALSLYQMFFIVDDAVNWNPFFRQHIYYEHLEQTANNFGVAPWRFGIDDTKVFDIDDINTEKYHYINDVAQLLLEVEEHLVEEI